MFVRFSVNGCGPNRRRRTALYACNLPEAGLDPCGYQPGGKEISDVNRQPEEANGRARAELIGSDFSDHFQFAGVTPGPISQGLRHRSRVTIPCDPPCSGSVMTSQNNATVHRVTTEEIDGIVVTVRDVSAQTVPKPTTSIATTWSDWSNERFSFRAARADEQARSGSLAKSDFSLANMSHANCARLANGVRHDRPCPQNRA